MTADKPARKSLTDGGAPCVQPVQASNVPFRISLSTTVECHSGAARPTASHIFTHLVKRQTGKLRRTWRRRTVAWASARRLVWSCSKSRLLRAISSSRAISFLSLSSAVFRICICRSQLASGSLHVLRNHGNSARCSFQAFEVTAL